MCVKKNKKKIQFHLSFFHLRMATHLLTSSKSHSCSSSPLLGGDLGFFSPRQNELTHQHLIASSATTYAINTSATVTLRQPHSLTHFPRIARLCSNTSLPACIPTCPPGAVPALAPSAPEPHRKPHMLRWEPMNCSLPRNQTFFTELDKGAFTHYIAGRARLWGTAE